MGIMSAESIDNAQIAEYNMVREGQDIALAGDIPTTPSHKSHLPLRYDIHTL